jgi:hypothetical protein
MNHVTRTEFDELRQQLLQSSRRIVDLMQTDNSLHMQLHATQMVLAWTIRVAARDAGQRDFLRTKFQQLKADVADPVGLKDAVESYDFFLQCLGKEPLPPHKLHLVPSPKDEDK